MSGLSLGTASSYFRQDLFTGWDFTSSSFKDPFEARLFRVDRFKTIYDRPTKRQKMTFGAEVDLPESSVVRRESDQNIFLVSRTLEREYWKGETNYDNVATLHRVMPQAGGLGTYRQASVEGIGDDLGPVVLSDAADVYMDTELRTAKDVDTSEEVHQSNVNAFVSDNVVPVSGDYFSLGDRSFLVETVTVDSGFLFCRLWEQPSTYTDGVYKFRSDETTTYNPATGVVSKVAAESREFSFIPGHSISSAEIERYGVSLQKTIYIYKRHLGFEPKLDDTIEIGGQDYRIKHIELSRLEPQWKLGLGV